MNDQYTKSSYEVFARVLLLGSHLSCFDYATLGLFCNNCVNEFPNYAIAPEGTIASNAQQKFLDFALFDDRRGF